MARPLEKGDWIYIQQTEEIGVVERAMDGGERVWVRIPSVTDWPWPRWAHLPADKVKRVRPPKPPKPEITTEKALL